jgi:hypothetical protein
MRSWFLLALLGATASAAAGEVLFLKGRGDGTFAPPQATAVGGAASIGEARVADFDADGNLDVAALASQATTLCVPRGNGQGGLGNSAQPRLE